MNSITPGGSAPRTMTLLRSWAAWPRSLFLGVCRPLQSAKAKTRGTTDSSRKTALKLIEFRTKLPQETRFCLEQPVGHWVKPLTNAKPDRLLDLFSSIYQFCRQHGYQPEGEAVTVGAWPVQFIPTFDRLTEAALRNAETAEVDGVPMRVVAADYLAAIALSVGRAKDFARVCALLEAKATTPDAISRLCSEFGLTSAWDRFRTRFPDA